MLKVGNMRQLIAAHAANDAAGIQSARSALLGVEAHELIGAIRAVTLDTIPEGIRSAPGFQETLRRELAARSDEPAIQYALVEIGFAAIANSADANFLGAAIESTFAPAVMAGTARNLDMRSLPFFMIAESFGNTLLEIGIADLLQHSFGSAKQAD